MKKLSRIFTLLTIAALLLLPVFSCTTTSVPEQPAGPPAQQEPTANEPDKEPAKPEEEANVPPATEVPPKYSEEEVLIMVEERLLGFEVDPFMGPRKITGIECFIEGYDPRLREWTGPCFFSVEDYNTQLTASWNLLEESGDVIIRGHFRQGEYRIPGSQE